MAQLKCGLEMPRALLLQHSHKTIRASGVCFSASSASLDSFQPLRAEDQQQQSRRKTIAGVDQSLLLDPWLLADANSRFAEYNGVQVHYKISKPSSGSGKIPAILLHGFGASVFSWERVLEPLARVLGAAAVAFDRPGFGLTSRVVPASAAASENPYTLEFSAAIALAFVNFLQAEKAVLIGHSAGCIVAADAYFKAPEKVAAMILIAPAIAAPLIFKQKQQQDQDQEIKSTSKDIAPPASEQSFPSPVLNFITSLLTRLRNLALKIFSGLANSIQNLKEIAVAFYCKLIAAALRSKLAIWMLRAIMDGYGEKVVRFAWYNPDKADEAVIRGYTKPLGCRNWERALLEYVVALVSKRDKDQKSFTEKLQRIECPVLVMTGDTDRLVPAWNAERLAKIFPHSSFHLIKQCGHLPHEEKPEEVMNIIKDFVHLHATVGSC